MKLKRLMCKSSKDYSKDKVQHREKFFGNALRINCNLFHKRPIYDQGLSIDYH